MHYKTRHLEAISDIPLGNEYKVPGDKFFATPIDAEYLLQHKKVIELEAPAAPAPAPRLPLLDESPPVLDFNADAGAKATGAIESAAASDALAAETAAPAEAPVIAAPDPAPAPAAPAPAPRAARKTIKTGGR